MLENLNKENYDKEMKHLITETSSNVIKGVFGIVDASIPILFYIRFFHPQGMNPLELIITFFGFLVIIHRELLNHSLRSTERKIMDKYKNINNTTNIP